jgi:hypothetical protein
VDLEKLLAEKEESETRVRAQVERIIKGNKEKQMKPQETKELEEVQATLNANKTKEDERLRVIAEQLKAKADALKAKEEQERIAKEQERVAKEQERLAKEQIQREAAERAAKEKEAAVQKYLRHIFFSISVG